MKTREIVICALRVEALQNPESKIIIGQKVMTYKELASKLTKPKSLPKIEKQFVESFITQSVTLFNHNPAFRTKMLSLASAR